MEKLNLIKNLSVNHVVHVPKLRNRVMHGNNSTMFLIVSVWAIISYT